MEEGLAKLAPEDRKKVMSTNAARVYKIDV
jgi:predicted TIM-barrel fold metal-dependent hydrolase